MRYLFKFILLTLPFILIHCSENGLFDQKINSDQFNIIRGKVLLRDDINPDSIYVWMDGLNQATYTDKTGDFMLELPAAELQPGGGLNGVYKLYYFLANYKIKYSTLFLINGKIERSKGDIDSRGNVFPEIWLSKLLDIRTETEPSSIDINYTGDVLTKVYLTNKVDSVRVNTFRWAWGAASALIIRQENTGPNDAMIIVSHNTEWRDEVITEPTTWYMIHKFKPGFFDPAVYHFYPLLEVVQEDIPAELLKSLGEAVYSFSLDYMKLPYRQTPGVFTVLSIQ